MWHIVLQPKGILDFVHISVRDAIHNNREIIRGNKTLNMFLL